MRRPALLLLLLLLLLPGALAVHAQAPEQSDAFVFGINAAVPGAVIGAFAPPSVESIYFLADQTSILSPRRTRVYFWPITNEYRAAWSELNEEVAGVLEVLQNGQIIAELEQVSYTIHFSAGGGAQRPQLYVGDEAQEADARFLAMQSAYRDAVLAYQEAREAWLARAREAQSQGLDGAASSPAPQPPPAFNLFSTGLNRGYPLQLPVGDYQIRTRSPQGDIVPGSERRLVIFAPRRTAVGYEVVPESRWTFPEEANDRTTAIMGRAGTVIYLKPRIVREYPALAYEHLQNPQYVGDATGSEWLWVSGETIEDAQMEILRDGRVAERVALAPYFVRQVPGGELGYEIVPYSANTPDQTPRVDFTAYRVALDAEQSSFAVQLRSPEDQLLSGSTRQVRVVTPLSLYALLPIALLPLACGAALLLWRRRQTESKKFV